MIKKELLISGSCIYKNYAGKTFWFIVKNDEDSGWELPKASVRRGESSVRTAIRVAAERGGMKVKVIEEAGRVTGGVVVSGKPISQKTIFYLMSLKELKCETIFYISQT